MTAPNELPYKVIVENEAYLVEMYRMDLRRRARERTKRMVEAGEVIIRPNDVMHINMQVEIEWENDVTAKGGT